MVLKIPQLGLSSRILRPNIKMKMTNSSTNFSREYTQPWEIYSYLWSMTGYVLHLENERTAIF